MRLTTVRTKSNQAFFVKSEIYALKVKGETGSGAEIRNTNARIATLEHNLLVIAVCGRDLGDVAGRDLGGAGGRKHGGHGSRMGLLGLMGLWELGSQSTRYGVSQITSRWRNFCSRAGKIITPAGRNLGYAMPLVPSPGP